MYFTKKKIIFSSKYFDLDCVFISNTGNDRERGILGYSITSFSSRELLAAASTSFSDENYNIILFSEYRIVLLSKIKFEFP